MISPIRPSIDTGSSDLAPEMYAALSQLARANDYALELDCDCWDFAVEIDRLFSLGLTTSDLRWLVKRGYVRHACELTLNDDTIRRFYALELTGMDRARILLGRPPRGLSVRGMLGMEVA